MKGPIYMDWLGVVTRLPGKALNVALAVHWLVDMNNGQPAKITAKALNMLNISEDAFSDGLKRLEHAGLVAVTRKPGQRPTVGIKQPVPPR